MQNDCMIGIDYASELVLTPPLRYANYFGTYFILVTQPQ